MPKRTFLIMAGLLAMLHLYIAARLLPALPLGLGGMLAAGLLLCASCLLIPSGMFIARRLAGPWADRLAWAGMLAMGLFSSLLVLTVLRDALLLVLLIAHAPQTASAHASAIGVPVLALAVTLLGLVNARRVARVVEVVIPIAGLAPALHGYSIVQISDIHVGATIKRAYLEAIVDKVNALQADAIAVTGDIVDGSVLQLGAHTAPLGRLCARDGAFFVTGNHEYYSNANAWIAEMTRLGLTVLMNQHVLRERDGAQVLIAGVTDFTAHHFDETHRSDPHAAIFGAPADVGVKILLAHQPRSAFAAADAGFDLQLSGHTHGGQFFPWNLFVPLQQPYTAGLNRLRALWVYTSRGTGYWGPPKRFGAPSEITRLRLMPA